VAVGRAVSRRAEGALPVDPHRTGVDLVEPRVQPEATGGEAAGHRGEPAQAVQLRQDVPLDQRAQGGIGPGFRFAWPVRVGADGLPGAGEPVAQDGQRGQAVVRHGGHGAAVRMAAEHDVGYA
jgi:hypothetical protein